MLDNILVMYHFTTRQKAINANPAKLVELDTYIMHWVAVYLDKVGIVNRLLLNLSIGVNAQLLLLFRWILGYIQLLQLSLFTS